MGGWVRESVAGPSQWTISTPSSHTISPLPCNRYWPGGVAATHKCEGSPGATNRLQSRAWRYFAGSSSTHKLCGAEQPLHCHPYDEMQDHDPWHIYMYTRPAFFCFFPVFLFYSPPPRRSPWPHLPTSLAFQLLLENCYILIRALLAAHRETT